mmetsp:Transcript_20788/g.41596  ORF Transcript_20788/g.41596 Transcript_20788/m.41596 type:complete len:114 (+) Transcript_20788:1075-1416(+)
MNGKVAEDLANKEKYFVLYCWYAKNIYHTCGLDNRRLLSHCIVNQIRTIFLEASGEYSFDFFNRLFKSPTKLTRTRKKKSPSPKEDGKTENPSVQEQVAWQTCPQEVFIPQDL